jgi:hypothetical protein
MSSRFWIAALLVLCAVPEAVAKKRFRPCPDARYLLPDQPSLVTGARGPDAGAVIVQGRQVAIEGGCTLVAAKVTPTRRGTRLDGRWRNCGRLQRVRLIALVDPSCEVISGTLRARKVRKAFTGRRSECGDGLIDRRGGEECEPPASAVCDERCRSVVTTTTAPVATTTTVPVATTTTTVPVTTTTTTAVASTTTTAPAATTTTTVFATTTTTLGGQGMWSPTTVPFDPACTTSCPEIARSHPLAHSEAVLALRVNPAIDDPIAQWGDCLESVLDCFERDGTLAPCIADAACPAECKALFQAQAAAAADEEARLDVFEAVFLERAAPCRPADEVAP